MKPTVKILLSVLALGAVASVSALKAQDNTPPPPADGSQPPPAPGQGGQRGPRGGRGMLNPDERVAQIDKAVTLTADQKTKIKDILVKAQQDMQALAREDRRTKGREIMQAAQDAVRAALTPEQQTKFDAMPQPGPGGRRGGGPGGPGGGKKQGD